MVLIIDGTPMIETGLKRFGHTKKEGLLLAVALHVGLAVLFAVATLFHWGWISDGPGDVMSFERALFTVVAAPAVVSLIAFSAFWLASRHSITVDQHNLIVLFKGQEVERRSTSNFLTLETRTFGSQKSWMTFRGEADLPIRQLNSFQLRALSRYIQEITQRNERNRNEVRKESSSPHAS